jgi:hypothetical protein
VDQDEHDDGGELLIEGESDFHVLHSPLAAIRNCPDDKTVNALPCTRELTQQLLKVRVPMLNGIWRGVEPS